MIELYTSQFTAVDSKLYQFQSYGSSQQAQSDNALFPGSDTVTLTGSLQESEFSAYGMDMKIQGLASDGYDQLRSYVVSLLEEQNVETKIQIGDEEIDLSQIDSEQAAALVADDGYFGVEQTADRIVDFSIALAGNDPSRLAAIREGIEKGFNDALEAFGGWLPDISYQTFDAIQEKLDNWASSFEG